MKVIGFGGSGHDWSACIVEDGRVLVFADEDRLTRIKYGVGSNLLNSRARRACLEACGCDPSEIDLAVSCDLVPLTLAAPFRRRLVRIRHHLAHAYGAFFCSPFPRAAVLVVDNGGSPLNGAGFDGKRREVETLTYWHAEGRQIRHVGEVGGEHLLNVARTADYYHVGETDNSLGHLYWTTSEELGFVHRGANGSVISEDGKTMGLAGYGDMRFVDELNEYLSLLEEGRISLKLTDGGFREHLRILISRGPDAPEEALARRAAVARAVQAMLERALLHAATYLRHRTGERLLALAGGVALNCVANSRIAREAGFDEIFVLPAAGDNGNALGAAIYGLLELGGYAGPLDLHGQLPFLGPDYKKSDLNAACAHATAGGAAAVERAQGQGDDAVAAAAQQLAEGKVVAWYEGRSEFGPRALGHRSILADPRRPEMKDRVNKVIKRREPFRPFAPMAPAEVADTYFDMPLPSPFMLFAGEVRAGWRGQLPAVTHVDGTARVQTVDRERFPSMHRLLHEFGRLTGIPVLLNTSFNRAGEPMVETPMDAARCFVETDIDVLVLEGRVIAKTPQRCGFGD